MRKIFVCVTGLLIASRAPAQTVDFISDSRSVSVSGFAQASPLAATNYSSSQAPTSAFADFQGSVGGSAQSAHLFERPSASSGASQNSSLSAGGIDFSSSLFAAGRGSGSGGESVLAQASSSLSVSFSVSSPTIYNLSFPTAGGLTAYSQFDSHFDFLSANSGSVSALVDSDQTGLPGITSSYMGILQPGNIYTIDATLQLGTDLADPMGGFYNFNYGFSMDLTTPELSSVPEPSSSLLLGMGAGLAGLVALGRKNLFAAPVPVRIKK